MRAPRLTTSFWLMLARALVARCPRCGGKGWIVRWFRRLDRCRTCGYKVARQPGFSLGAITINIIVTFALLAVTLTVGIVASYPDLAVVPILVVGLFVAIVVPVAAFPLSQTVWAALDLAMHPLEASEVVDAARVARGEVDSAEVSRDP